MPQNIDFTAKRVLITGGAGCVGQYLVEEMLKETPHHLVMIVRNPGKLTFDAASNPRITLIEADMTEIESYRDRLGHIDVALLAAAAWGGPPAYKVNLEANLALTDYVAAQPGGGRVIFFATGSVLDAEGNMLPPAHELGSEYIRSKYELVEEIEKRGDKVELIGLYPTLILGGGDGKPFSHFANLLREARPWAWLARFFRADAKFHYIHAKDIARVARHLTDAPVDDIPQPRRLVLGNRAETANSFIEGFSRYLGYRSYGHVTVKEWFAEGLIKIFRIQLSPWDRYCMHNRDLSYRRIWGPADFGLPVHCPDLAAALSGIGIERKK